ncbi:MAG: cupin domain-containing protein [Acidobacteriota bacterium]|nr:cupin domain-containing protein [Acidobacteriota bacterium]
MEWIVQPEGYVPFEHVHLAQEEIFHVKEGELRIVLDGKEHIGKASDTITVPKGTRHVAYNNRPDVLTCVVEYRPGLDYYKFFQCFAGLTLDHDVNRKGGVNIPKMLYFARKTNTQALARPTNIPGPLFRLLMNVFYLVGTLAGWERQYQKYTGEGIARHDEAATQFQETTK